MIQWSGRLSTPQRCIMQKTLSAAKRKVLAPKNEVKGPKRQ